MAGLARLVVTSSDKTWQAGIGMTRWGLACISLLWQAGIGVWSVKQGQDLIGQAKINQKERSHEKISKKRSIRNNNRKKE